MSAPDRHYDAEELVDYFCKQFDDEAARVVELHLAGCDACAGLARRVYAATSVLEQTSMDSLRRAATSRASSPVRGAIAELVFTVQGWIVKGAGGARPDVGTAIGKWLFAATFEPQGARLSAFGEPVTLEREVPGVGSLLIQIVPAAQGDWTLIAKLVAESPRAGVVVGLGGADRPHLGTRTVTPSQEQQFLLGLEDLQSGLHLHVEWQDDSGRRHTEIPLPVRGEV